MDYKFSVEEKSEISRNINIEIPREVYNKRFDHLLSQTVQRVRLKGFRPGHAPKAMVAKLYHQQLHSDVMNELVSAAYKEAVTTHSLRVVGQPEISLQSEDEKEDLKVTAEVAIFPDPQIANYRDLSFDVEVEEASEERVQERILGLREQESSTEVVTDRDTVEPQDLVTINYSGTVDGVAFPGSSGEEVLIELGSPASIAEIDQALVGAKVGETRTATITLPEDSGQDLAGKPALYEITIVSIHRKVLPELNDEFAKSTQLAEDVQGLTDAIRKQLETEAARKNENEREEKLFRKLIELNPFEVPQALVDHEIRTILMEMKFLDPRKEESYRVDVSRFRAGLSTSAEFRVKRSIILDKLIEQENFTIGDEQLGEWLDEQAAKAGRPREEIEKVYGFPKNLKQLKEIVCREKMVDRLLSEASINEVPAGSGEAA